MEPECRWPAGSGRRSARMAGATAIRRTLAVGALAVMLPLVAAVEPAGAQRPPQSSPTPAAKAAPPTKTAAKSSASSSSARGGDAQLRQRVEQLEEQLADMQVTLGTLDSLGRGSGRGPGPAAAGAAASSGGFAPGDSARVDSLEMQLRALSNQIEQLAERLRGLEAGGGRFAASGSRVPMPLPPPAAEPGQPSRLDGSAGGFGTVTVRPGERQDDIGRIIQQDAGRVDRRPQQGSTEGVGARAVYDRAYNFLLQQDYGAAEAAFEDFLARFPHEPLAGSAQYWLGESLFVRGQYRSAASMFLKGYQTYATSPKAPDSLLKLAMSLARLNQREAACSSFNELSQRYPDAPAHVKTRAEAERRRARC
jgi:tol-pal system protein YbgF